MVTHLALGEVTVAVLRKNIKNIHLSVNPPAGEVKISAPLRMSLDTVRLFAMSKLGWIKRHQQRLRAQHREAPHEFLDLEIHHLWGKRYLLRLIEADAAASIELTHNEMLLRVRPGADQSKKRAVVEQWYRQQLKRAAAPLIAKWEPVIGVKVAGLFVQRMKTRWGSCAIRTGFIRLNTDLASRSPEFLEFIIVHEMTHLIERHHNKRFYRLMDQWLPSWKLLRQQLNRR